MLGLIISGTLVSVVENGFDAKEDAAKAAGEDEEEGEEEGKEAEAMIMVLVLVLGEGDDDDEEGKEEEEKEEEEGCRDAGGSIEVALRRVVALKPEADTGPSSDEKDVKGEEEGTTVSLSYT